MDKLQLDPVAEVLVHPYLETRSYSRQFSDEYEQPPTMIAKIQHMRSITQAKVIQSERFDLREPYIEFGRVEIVDNENTSRYLLRSDGAVAVERAKRQQAFFDSKRYLVTEVTLLVYRFHENGLDLSVAGTRHEVGRYRLEATGTPAYVATWPFSAGPAPFDQGVDDPFGDLGDLRDDGDGTGSK